MERSRPRRTLLAAIPGGARAGLASPGLTAVVLLGMAACGGKATDPWLEMPEYPSSFVMAPGGTAVVPVGPRGEGVEPLTISIEGGDGQPVAPPLAAAIPPVVEGGPCQIRRLGPSSVLVGHMCPDIPYLRATVTAEPGAAPLDVQLRVRVDYQERLLPRQAVAPLTVSIRP